jgi:hypothetical protein
MKALRGALALVSVGTIALAAWLAATVLLVLPTRDPTHVGLWATVAVGAAALAGVSWLATRRTHRARPPVAVALLVLGLASLAFGVLVLETSLSDALTADREGYLLVIGLLLAVHGALALGWIGAQAGSRAIRR